MTVHNNPNPNCAPAREKVAIAEGSSSAAPAIIPGPKDFRDSLKDVK